MNKTIICVLYAAVTLSVGSVLGLLTSCHALVVADKLYYQGSIGKKQPRVELSDSIFVSDGRD